MSQPHEPAEKEADAVADHVADKLHGDAKGEHADQKSGDKGEAKPDAGKQAAPKIGAKLWDGWKAWRAPKAGSAGKPATPAKPAAATPAKPAAPAKGLPGKPGASPVAEPQHDPEAVKRKAGQQLAAKLSGEVPANASMIRSALAGVHAGLKGEGLKALEVRQVAGKVGAFEVLATASPKEVVTQFFVSDLQLGFPRTALLAKLNNNPLGRFTNRKVQTEGGDDVAAHAENVLITSMRAKWPTLVTECKLQQNKPAPFEVTITRTPCDKEGHACGPLLENFVAEKKAAKYPLNLSLRMMSTYKGPGGGDAKKVLSGLRASGAQLSVVTVKQLLAEGLIQGGGAPDEVVNAIDGGTVVDKNGKAKTVAGAVSELKTLLDQIEAEARIGQ